jgi:hypothetical protein
MLRRERWPPLTRRRSTVAGLAQVGRRLFESDPAAASAFDSLEYVMDGRSFGETFQFRGKDAPALVAPASTRRVRPTSSAFLS